jgi:XapX domain-containing protein
VIKIVVGVAIALCIGASCRVFGLPVPGPPAILGAFLAVAMATGYTVMDRVLTARARASTTPPSPTATVGESRHCSGSGMNSTESPGILPKAP